MKKTVRTQLKLTASALSLLLWTACGQSSGGGGKASAACGQGRDLTTAFQTMMAKTPSQGGQKHLLIKMSDLNGSFEAFRADLMAEYAQNKTQARVKKIAHNLISVDLPEDAKTSQVIDRYIHDKQVKDIEPDYPTFSVQSVSDSNEVATDENDRGNQDANKPGAGLPIDPSDPAVKAAAAEGKEIVVAIIDTGVDYTHKDLAPYMWHNPKEIPNNGIDDDGNGFVDDVYGWDFANNDNNPMSDDAGSYHGTHVAGIVKQAAQLAEMGIKVKIMALKYLDASASGRTSVAIQAIDYAIKNGAKVLNNSWGSYSYSTAMSDAIERARQSGVLFMAAAGNGDSSGNGVNIDQAPFYPAGYPHDNIVSVAAVNNYGELASWSNYGPIRVDIAAPGVGILSTRNGNAYAYLSGTSMATPYVSGVAAMIWSLRSDLSYNEVRRVLGQSAIATPSLSGKVVTNAMISRSGALKVANTYVHNPNDKGTPDMTPVGLCTP